MSDTRITLPDVARVAAVAAFYCTRSCVRQGGRVTHTNVCLTPTLERRAAMLAEPPSTYGISDDCTSGKHDPICNGTGCECPVCHT